MKRKSFDFEILQVIIVCCFFILCCFYLAFLEFSTLIDERQTIKVELVTENSSEEIMNTVSEYITTEIQTKKMIVTATAYCPCEKCCGKWAKNRNGIVLTASGAEAKPEHTIAVDTDVFPFGTVIIIDGKEYVAEDTGKAVKGYMIDIYFESHEEAQSFGKKQIEIEVKQ